MLKTDDLNEYFSTNSIEIEDLLKLADWLTSNHLTMQASEQALYGRTSDFVIGLPWIPLTPSWVVPRAGELNQDNSASDLGSFDYEDNGVPKTKSSQTLMILIIN